MSETEIQEEEREALLSIYEGDSAFKQIDPATFQYKYGDNDDIKSFLLEIQWGDSYPTEKPTLNMDMFYNKHIKKSIKDKISELVLAEAEQYLGMSMTYSLFEYVREKFEELICLQDDVEDELEIAHDDIRELTITECLEDGKKKPKKEQLTKAQKRRQWNKVGEKGERPRGWDWVDIVKHLSQTGNKDEQMPSSAS